MVSAPEDYTAIRKRYEISDIGTPPHPRSLNAKTSGRSPVRSPINRRPTQHPASVGAAAHDLIASYDDVTRGIEAELVNIIHAKGRDMESLSKKLNESKFAVNCVHEQLNTSRRMHEHSRELCSTFLLGFIDEVGRAIHELHREQRQQKAHEADYNALENQCRQLHQQLEEKEATIGALQGQVSMCEDSLDKALASVKVSTDKANMQRASMEQEITRLSSELNEMRSKEQMLRLQIQEQKDGLVNANQHALEETFKNQQLEHENQRLEHEVQSVKDKIRIQDKLMLDMTDKVLSTKEQWVAEKEATEMALKLANDKHADTKKKTTALRDLKLSFAERAKDAEAAKVASEEKLAKAVKALKEVRSRLTIVERGMSQERQQKEYLAEKLALAQQTLDAGETPAKGRLDLFQVKPGTHANERRSGDMYRGKKHRQTNQTATKLQFENMSGVDHNTLRTTMEERDYLAEQLAEAQSLRDRLQEDVMLFQAQQSNESREHLQWKVLNPCNHTARKDETGEEHERANSMHDAEMKQRIETLEALLNHERQLKEEALRVEAKLLDEEAARELEARQRGDEGESFRQLMLEKRMLESEICTLTEVRQDRDAQVKALAQENKDLRLEGRRLRQQLEKLEQDWSAKERMHPDALPTGHGSGMQCQDALWTRVIDLQAENAKLHRTLQNSREQIARLELNENKLKEHLSRVQSDIIECSYDLSCALKHMKANQQAEGDYQVHVYTLGQEVQALKACVQDLLSENAKSKRYTTDACSTSSCTESNRERENMEAQLEHLLSENLTLRHRNETLAESISKAKAHQLESAKSGMKSTASPLAATGAAEGSASPAPFFNMPALERISFEAKSGSGKARPRARGFSPVLPEIKEVAIPSDTDGHAYTAAVEHEHVFRKDQIQNGWMMSESSRASDGEGSRAAGCCSSPDTVSALVSMNPFD